MKLFAMKEDTVSKYPHTKEVLYNREQCLYGISMFKLGRSKKNIEKQREMDRDSLFPYRHSSTSLYFSSFT